MAGMAVAAGDWNFALRNVGRAAADIGMVLLVGAIVLGVKRWRMHREDTER